MANFNKQFTFEEESSVYCYVDGVAVPVPGTISTEPLPINLQPSDIAAETAEAISILDYQPEISPTPKLGTSTPPPTTPGTITTTSDGKQVPPHPAATQIVNITATYLDAIALQNYIQDLLVALETRLANNTVPTSGDGINSTATVLLEAGLNSKEIGFSDLQNALEHPEDPNSAAILYAWQYGNWGLNGDVAAQIYPDIWRFNQYMPVLTSMASTLISLVAFTLMGTASDDPHVNLSSVISTLDANSYDIDPDALHGYMVVQDTISSISSNFTYTINGMVSTINSNTQVPAAAVQLISDLGQGFASQPNNTLSSIISILQTIELLYTVFSASSWLSISAIEATLTSIAIDLAFSLLGEAMGVYSHIQAQLLTPIVNMVRGLDSIFGYNKTASINSMCNSIVTLLGGVMGKFNQYALDFYRWAQLQNSNTANRSGQISNNNSLRNMVKVINELISVLQLIQALESGQLTIGNIVGTAIGDASQVISQEGIDSQTNWGNIASQVGNNLATQYGVNPNLQLPPTLTIPRPSPGAGILEIVSGPEGLAAARTGQSTRWSNVPITGTLSGTASSLLDEIASHLRV